MLKFTFLGDVMCKHELIQAFETSSRQYDFSPIFEKIKPLLAQSDYVFANLETPISIDNKDLTEKQWEFFSPFEFAQAAKNAGIDFVATANNHCLDRGMDGVVSTVNSLDKIRLAHTGTFSEKSQRNQVCIVKVGTLNIGVLSYTYGTNAFSNHQYLTKEQAYAVNLFQNQELSNPVDRYCYYHRENLIAKVYNKLSEKFCPGQISGPIYEHREFSFRCKKKCRNDIEKLKKAGADIIVMYMHAGGQYNDQATEYTRNLTEWLLKNGVDIVAGSHEHVVHGGIFDRIGHGKLATYSLGNFDGIAGVYAEPMDKMAEYSIGWHIYITDKGKLQKTTYTILKTISAGQGKIQVVPCIDLLKSDFSEKTVDEIEKISEIFSGQKIDRDTLKTQCEIPVVVHKK